MTSKPLIIVLAGPNGAGKSTAAVRLLPEGIPFLNADEIAKTLANYPSPAADLEAGRITLERMNEMEPLGSDFAVETTLAGRSLAARVRDLRVSGYRFRLLFLFLPSEEMAIARVADRVHLGGHNIPEPTIRKRYHAGIRNFFNLYLPLADRWSTYDNTQRDRPRFIAGGAMNRPLRVRRAELWDRMKAEIDR